MRRVGRGFLLFVSILNGVAGLIFGVLFIISPDGGLIRFQPFVEFVGTAPFADIFFRDLFWIGVAMLIALAAPNLTASVMLLRRNEKQYIATTIAAMLLMLWCGFELIFLFNVAAVGYFAVGVLSALASALLGRVAEHESV